MMKITDITDPKTKTAFMIAAMAVVAVISIVGAVIGLVFNGNPILIILPVMVVVIRQFYSYIKEVQEKTTPITRKIEVVSFATKS